MPPARRGFLFSLIFFFIIACLHGTFDYFDIAFLGIRFDFLILPCPAKLGLLADMAQYWPIFDSSAYFAAVRAPAYQLYIAMPFRA